MIDKKLATKILPPFNDEKLQEIDSQYRSIASIRLKNIDAWSKDLRIMEAKLSKLAIPKDAQIDFCIDDNFTLRWHKNRIMVYYTDTIHESWEKPLIECALHIRLDLYNYLVDFYKKAMDYIANNTIMSE